MIIGVDYADRSDFIMEAAFLANVDEKNIPPDDFLNTIKGSCFYQMPVPDNLEKKTYGAMYRQLAADGIIPLGLFRGIFSNMSWGPKSNKMPYVFTNPDFDTELYTCDQVYVLSLQPINSIEKLTVKVYI